jgi:hypothetical protein
MAVSFAQHDRSMIAATSYGAVQILTLRYNK